MISRRFAILGGISHPHRPQDFLDFEITIQPRRAPSLNSASLAANCTYQLQRDTLNPAIPILGILTSHHSIGFLEIPQKCLAISTSMQPSWSDSTRLCAQWLIHKPLASIASMVLYEVLGKIEIRYIPQLFKP